MKRSTSLIIALVMCLAMPIGSMGAGDSAPAKAKLCVACHGADGNSVSDEFPSLAGQVPGYIAAQLAGAFIAGGILYSIGAGGVGTPAPGDTIIEVSTQQAILIEAVLTFLLMTVIMGTAVAVSYTHLTLPTKA